MSDDISTYLSGEKLYGDDFTIDKIKEWYADEAEGYANLGAKEQNEYQYVYHALNKKLGFNYLPNDTFNEVLGIGSAYGEELEPISDKTKKFTILDPSDAFADVKEILQTPCDYIKPRPDGNMPFKDNHFDLITSFGVMHHIPNVSHVLNECYRCLEKDGFMLFREPIVSMGDWSRPRTGLTKRERGIPLHIAHEIIQKSGFKVVNKSLCTFPLMNIVAGKMGVSAYNSDALTMIDKFLSQVFAWNVKYHRTKFYEKFAPASIFYVLKK